MSWQYQHQITIQNSTALYIYNAIILQCMSQLFKEKTFLFVGGESFKDITLGCSVEHNSPLY